MQKNLWKRFFAVLLSVAMISTLSACGKDNDSDQASTNTSEGKPQEFFVKVATGQSGGTYYPIGIAMAQVFSDNIPGCVSSGMATGGSVDNIGLLRDGEAQVAMITATTCTAAYNGTGSFEGNAYEDLRAICALWENNMQIVVPNNITSIMQLEGKKVVVGANGSGGELECRTVFGTFELYYNNEDASKNNVEAVYLDYAQGVDALKDGQVSGVFNDSHAPSSAITDLLSTGDYHVLEFTDDELEAIKAQKDLYDIYTVPANSYPNQDKDLKTIGYPVLLTCPASADAEQIYSLAETIFNHTDDLINAHSAAKSITPENAVKGLSVPLHEGAEQYFTEKGIL